MAKFNHEYLPLPILSFEVILTNLKRIIKTTINNLRYSFFALSEARITAHTKEFKLKVNPGSCNVSVINLNAALMRTHLSFIPPYSRARSFYILQSRDI